jgi:NADH-quinone oxidoreductase subunit N
MNWSLFIPELYFLLMIGVFLCLALLARSNPKRDFFIALVLATAGVVVCLASVKLKGTLFFDVYRVDLFSQVFKLILATGFFLVICLCSELRGIEEHHHPEFYLLLTTCTLAMMLLVSSVELLTIYVALELSSYSLYLLVPLRKGYGVHVESGIKYFVAEIIKVLPGAIGRPTAIIGLLLTLCGFFFKLAVFPFHFWAPDAYQGAANQVTAYIATASKVAAVAILIRMVALSSGSGTYLVHILVTLSIASMTVGNLIAIVQKDMKRLLAYSSISHAGYVLIGILSMNQSGYAGAIFYAVAYLIMQFTCFLVVVKVAYDGADLQIEGLAGLHRRSPMLAMALLLGVFSLGGIPPTIGFTGKFLVFTAAMKNGYFTLVLIAMVNVVISLYYYILVVKAAYLLEADASLPRLQVSFPTKVLTGTLVTAMLVLGVFPQYLLELAQAAASALM